MEHDDELYRTLSSQLQDEPGTPELAPHIPALADGLRQALIDSRPWVTGILIRSGHRAGCPCSDSVGNAVAFLSAMDDDDLTRYFGRWLRETRIVDRFLADKSYIDHRCADRGPEPA